MNIKIICIEDEEDVRSDIVEVLSAENYEVLEANNGKEGLEAIIKHQPDLILSDITMPVMDGYELIKKLHGDYPDYSEIPFIFLSALADRENVIKGLKLGSDDYISKPIDFEFLLTKIALKCAQIQQHKVKRQEQELQIQVLETKLQSNIIQVDYLNNRLKNALMSLEENEEEPSLKSKKA